MRPTERQLDGRTNDPSAGSELLGLSRPARVSHLVLIGMLVLAAWFRLGTPFVTILFAYFVLKNLAFLKKNWLKVTIFIALVSVICGGLGYFLDQSIRHLPDVANKAIPAMIQSAKKYGLELPFSDWESLKIYTLDSVIDEFKMVGAFANRATKQFIFMVIGIVIATSIFLNPFAAVQGRNGGSDNLYAVYGHEIVERFRSFYYSFANVMGAQLIISSINTALTSIFILCTGMPLSALAIAVTFLCGILPIIGNLISNTIIVCIAFTVSPQMAAWALAFLVVLHKLEYFLNSKIIGRQIKNPVWLTLIALILGERLMGIPGMILAPVILDFIRRETSRIKAAKEPVSEPEKIAV